MQYCTDKGYYYEIQKGGAKRISKKKYLMSKKKGKNKPKVGNSVTIIVKPYKKNKKIKGIVKIVLTKKQFHSRGHKVELKNGTIGRVL
tara:strand:- start:339 stop:602 length:264 start_codon:yes stop_codon:yes gene_type:complete